MKDKLVFGIRSCLLPPYPERTEECLNTWGKNARDLGYSVKVLLGNPNIEDEYLDSKDVIWSKASDNNPPEIFEKTVLYPCKWFLNETEYEYFFITDSDTFIDVDKVIPNLEKIIEEYIEVDYMGCCNPFPGDNVNIPTIKYIEIPKDPNYAFASGGSGFLLSRKAAKILIDNFDAREWHEKYGSTIADDLIVSKILGKHGVPLLHNGHLFFDSPFRKTIIYADGLEPPYMGDNTGKHLITQHYVSGKMEEINKYIKIKKHE